MRLIDADKLKEDIKENGCDRFETWDKMLTLAEYETFVGDVIDNAPTVEYPFYQEAYQTGYEEGKNERPHGEWVEWDDEKWGGTTVYCSVCKLKALRSSTNGFVMSNFCPNCGADMRGEEE